MYDRLHDGEAVVGIGVDDILGVSSGDLRPDSVARHIPFDRNFEAFISECDSPEIIYNPRTVTINPPAIMTMTVKKSVQATERSPP